VSTRNRASDPVASSASRTSETRLVTPVEVSLCTTITAAIEGSLRSTAATLSGSTPWRQSPSTQSTSSPSRSAIARHRVAKWPVSKASTRSPGDSVFTSAASQAPVPDDG
jgi:hypothetical protein